MVAGSSLRRFWRSVNSWLRGQVLAAQGFVAQWLRVRLPRPQRRPAAEAFRHITGGGALVVRIVRIRGGVPVVANETAMVTQTTVPMTGAMTHRIL